MCSVFVGNIAWDVSEQELGDWFSQCGTVNSSYIKTDRQSGQTLGFGFVEFNDPNIADDVIKRMDGSFLGGRNIRCNRSNRTSLSHENPKNYQNTALNPRRFQGGQQHQGGYGGPNNNHNQYGNNGYSQQISTGYTPNSVNSAGAMGPKQEYQPKTQRVDYTPEGGSSSIGIV